MMDIKQVWSFFSGGMGLDIGLTSVGLKPTLALEIDDECVKTIRNNEPGVTIIHDDISKHSEKTLRKIMDYKNEVFLVVGGPPCQSFSTGGKRSSISDPRGNLIFEYLRIIKEVQPRYFILENVANLITAAVVHRPIIERPGNKWNLSSYNNSTEISDDEKSGSAFRQIWLDVCSMGYGIHFQVVDSADYGAPQHRLRFIMIGKKDGLAPKLIDPIFGPYRTHPWRTIRDAIYDLKDDPGDHSEYTKEVKEIFDLVPPGGTWRNLPIEIQKKAMGNSYHSGGGKTGFFRRLSWDAPSPTLTTAANRKGSSLCHPENSRPLSVKEYSRIQGFPDSWKFSGSMSRIYRQIGNAVPIALGWAAGMSILKAEEGQMYSQYSFDEMFVRATNKLRNSAKNKRNKASQQELSL